MVFFSISRMAVSEYGDLPVPPRRRSKIFQNRLAILCHVRSYILIDRRDAYAILFDLALIHMAIHVAVAAFFYMIAVP